MTCILKGKTIDSKKLTLRDLLRSSDRAKNVRPARDDEWVVNERGQVLQDGDDLWYCATSKDHARGDDLWYRATPKHHARGDYVLPLAGPGRELWEAVERSEFVEEVSVDGIDREYRYHPLRMTGLFLEFARLVDGQEETVKEITKDVWVDWLWTYGVLGMQPDPEGGFDFWGDTRGGRNETFAAFVQAATQANKVLRLYETATSPGHLDVEALEELLPQPRAIQMWGQELKRKRRTSWQLRDLAMAEVRETVHKWIIPHCYLQASPQGRSYVQGYGFRSLIGAMYLQMFWLLTEPDRAVRCRAPQCNKIIALERSEEDYGSSKPDAKDRRKPRSDKQHCNNTCVQRRARYDKKLTEGTNVVGSAGQQPRRAGRPPLIPPENHALLLLQLRENPGVSLEEHCRIWLEQQGVAVSTPTMSRAIRDLDKKEGRLVPRY